MASHHAFFVALAPKLSNDVLFASPVYVIVTIFGAVSTVPP